MGGTTYAGTFIATTQQRVGKFALCKQMHDMFADVASVADDVIAGILCQILQAEGLSVAGAIGWDVQESALRIVVGAML